MKIVLYCSLCLGGVLLPVALWADTEWLEFWRYTNVLYYYYYFDTYKSLKCSKKWITLKTTSLTTKISLDEKIEKWHSCKSLNYRSNSLHYWRFYSSILYNQPEINISTMKTQSLPLIYYLNRQERFRTGFFPKTRSTTQS